MPNETNTFAHLSCTSGGVFYATVRLEEIAGPPIRQDDVSRTDTKRFFLWM